MEYLIANVSRRIEHALLGAQRIRSYVAGQIGLYGSFDD
jgi:hypothetical protein